MNKKNEIKKNNFNDYKIKQQRISQKSSNVDDDDDDDGKYDNEIEYKRRNAFTPGWTNNVSTKPALPIKEGNKIIKLHKEIKEEDDDDDEEDDDEDEDNNNNNKTNNNEDNQSLNNNKKSKDNFEKINKYQKMSYERIKIKIAEICTTATADPENSLRRVSNNNNNNDTNNDNSSKFIDMFDILKHNNPDVVELAMISILLVFKNIIPTYKIIKQDVDSEVML